MVHILFNYADTMNYINTSTGDSDMKDRLFKYSFLMLIGGFSYYYIEIAFRGYSHISMIICGGLCFILSGMINQVLGQEVSLISQMVISAIIITTVEFLTGVIVNIVMGLNVWDYSEMPYNVLGQICLPYSLIWFFLSLICIFLDDLIRYKVFDEEKVRYKIL